MWCAVGFRGCASEPKYGARLGDENNLWREVMSFGKGALLWLLGIPLPIILLLALFWR
jgi:hypothetical protein